MKKILAIIGGAGMIIVGALCTVGAIRRNAEKKLANQVSKKTKPKTKKKARTPAPTQTPVTADSNK